MRRHGRENECESYPDDAHIIEEAAEDGHRGHKLMKDKRDELMKEFLELARENGRLRQEVEQRLSAVYKNFTVASAMMSQEVMEESLMFPKQGVRIEVGSRNIMSVDVPVFSFKTTAEDPTDIFPYGFARTSGELDNAISQLSELFPMLLDLAGKGKGNGPSCRRAGKDPQTGQRAGIRDDSPYRGYDQIHYHEAG